MLEDELFIKAFIVKDRQDRYLNLIATSTGRRKLRNYIAHFKDLNAAYCTPVNSLRTSNGLFDLLKLENAPDLCYIISEDSRFDMKNISLLEATERLFGSGISFFLCCIPGKLAYYEGEDRNQQLLLKYHQS